MQTRNRAAFDIEAGLPMSEVPNADDHDSDGEGSPRGKPDNYKLLTSWQPLRTAHPQVRQAASIVDRLCVAAGGLVSSRPDVRAGLLAYLLVVHLVLWVHMVWTTDCGPVSAP